MGTSFCFYVILIENTETHVSLFLEKKHDPRIKFFEFPTFAPFLHTQCMDGCGKLAGRRHSLIQ